MHKQVAPPPPRPPSPSPSPPQHALPTSSYSAAKQDFLSNLDFDYIDSEILSKLVMEKKLMQQKAAAAESAKQTSQAVASSNGVYSRYSSQQVFSQPPCATNVNSQANVSSPKIIPNSSSANTATFNRQMSTRLKSMPTVNKSSVSGGEQQYIEIKKVLPSKQTQQQQQQQQQDFTSNGAVGISGSSKYSGSSSSKPKPTFNQLNELFSHKAYKLDQQQMQQAYY